MTLSVDGQDIMQIVEIVAWVASIIAMLVVGLLVYLMIRPPRHVRAAPRVRERDPADAEELWRIVDVMESRIEVLERALADQVERRRIAVDESEQDFAPVEDGRESGRKE